MPATAAASERTEREIAATSWYHTIELPGGIVTPGFYDTVTGARRFPFPASLTGKRCLDVGTSDGFWAFEMERRGAEQVVAIDVDDPADYDWPEPRPSRATRPANREAGVNRGFEIAHRALGSAVERVPVSVYRLADAGLGEFDFVFIGALLLHLRDPVGALAAVRSVTGGELLSADSISLTMTAAHPLRPAVELCGTGEPRWWTPNLAGHRRMIEAAGFSVLEAGRPFFMPFGRGFPAPRRLGSIPRRRLPAELAFRLAMRRLGAPSAWARCARA